LKRLSRNSHKALRGCLLTLLLLFAALLGIYIFSGQLLAAAASYLIEDDGPRKADAIVVLGGDGYGDRTLKAAALAKAGYAPFVLVSGPPSLLGYASGEEIQFAELHGYSASLFREAHLPADAESTRTEVRFLGKYMRDAGIKSVLLVTSNFHSKRAAKLWRQENPAIAATVVPSVDPDRLFTPRTWWKTRAGQKIFLYEWMKTISVVLGV
jgi:uncharacterized SAM-binding protein YcdF (DUF218 family)